jgi:hypothetical protein
LWLAGSLDVLKSDGAVVAVDAGQDDAVGAEILYVVSTMYLVETHGKNVQLPACRHYRWSLRSFLCRLFP